MGWWGFRPYVSVAKRRANALRELKKLEKKGQPAQPIKLDGKKIAATFWGTSWCENLEAYSDFENRLPRGRTYVRNGSVVDLRIEPGRVTARVAGSELYTVKIKIDPVDQKTWCAIRGQCAGQIGSLVELLQGRLSKGVMELVTRQQGGLFPKPAEIDMDCSCPDWADMCKHVVAVLYGIGARLDQQPELLFTLRQVDYLELIQNAGALPVQTSTSTAPTIAANDLADVFGIELESDAVAAAAPASSQQPKEADSKKRAKRQSQEKSKGNVRTKIAHGRPVKSSAKDAKRETKRKETASHKRPLRSGKRAP